MTDPAGPDAVAPDVGPTRPAAQAPPDPVTTALPQPAARLPRRWPSRARIATEVLLVVGLSLGRSGVFAVVQLLQIATARGGVASATATLNGSQSSQPWFDLTYQLLDIAFALVPVGLALFLLSERWCSPPPRPGEGAAAALLRRIGLDRARTGRDAVTGLALAAVIGIPGLGFYLIGRALGITADVQASGLSQHWWTAGVLVLSAFQNGLLEEVVVVAYLLDRLPRLGWSLPLVVAASAVLRGSYHLYQGYGPFFGNAVMGVLFALYYRRSRRVLPLVVAHTALDVVAFVGYQYLGGALGLK